MLNLLSSNISAIVDIVALIFVGVFALWGAIRGFTKTFFATFGGILSLLFAVLLSPVVAKFLQDKFGFVESISSGLGGVLTSVFGDKVMNTTLNQASHEFLSGAGLSGFLIDTILSLQTENTIPMDTTLNEIICPTFGYYVVVVICVIALYIIFKIIFYVLSEIVRNMHKYTIVAKLERWLGFALGLIDGIIKLELFIMVIAMIPIAICQDITLAIQSSVIAKFIQDINLFGLIMNGQSSINVTEIIKNIHAPTPTTP